MAKPSNPSVRFTALDEPTIIKIENGIKNQPRFITTFLKKGIYKFFKSTGFAKYVKIKIPMAAINIWTINLVLDVKPAELFPFYFF